MRHRRLTPFVPVQAEPTPLQGYVTRHQLAEVYKVTPGTIYLWQARDGLPFSRVGTQPVYQLAKVAEWFAARLDRMHGGSR